MTKQSDAARLSDAILDVSRAVYGALTNEEASVVVRGSQLEDIATNVDSIQYELEHARKSVDARLEDISDALVRQNEWLEAISTSLVTIAKAMEGRG